MLLSLRRLARKQTVPPFSIGVIFILLFVAFHGISLAGLALSFASAQFRQKAISQAEYANLFSRQVTFWRSFYPDLTAHAPICDPLIHPEDTHLEIPYNATQEQPRPDKVTLTGHQLHALRASHQSFVGEIKRKAAQYLPYNLPYIKKTQGIVTTAGGSYLPVAVISIRMLRKTGSQLPVEVFLAKQEEWDPQICGVVFPTLLNARCVVLQDIFDAAAQDKGVKIDKYQYKVMSILFSSFEEVLFMDSDCFPAYDPQQLFLSNPFSSTGLVLWPDFWFPSESSFFFDISGIKEPLVHVRPSTESGEIMYSKPKHQLSLLLATYYNYYGPDFYYPLQSQGAPGEGDKETFYWAAIALQEPIYSVGTMVRALGYTTTKGEWRGSAMVQHDPIMDLAMGDPRRNNDNGDAAQPAAPGQAEAYPPIHRRPYFVHANFPKFDPATIFQEEAMGATGPTRDADGTLRRVWQSTAAEAIEEFGFDLERRLWSEIWDTACEYEGEFLAWTGIMDICRNATTYWEAMFEGKSNLVTNVATG
jgi:alpha 1,2-mannosyltransferase